MKEPHSTSDASEEPERPATIPADFVWDPEYQAWLAAGEPSTLPEGYWDRFIEEMKKESQEHARQGRPRLITSDQLRAAGAFDVPPEWRKSLGGRKRPGGQKQRTLFSDLTEDDIPGHDRQKPTPRDADGNDPADELP